MSELPHRLAYRSLAGGYVYEEKRSIARDGSAFDRIAFAMRALRLLRPEGLTVCVREGRYELKVDAGRQWGARDGERWAVVSVPPDASREAIALALAELAGVRDDPFVLDVLMRSPEPQ